MLHMWAGFKGPQPLCVSDNNKAKPNSICLFWETFVLFSGRNTTPPGDSEQAGFLLWPALNNHIWPVLEYACFLLVLGKTLRSCTFFAFLLAANHQCWQNFPIFLKQQDTSPSLLPLAPWFQRLVSTGVFSERFLQTSDPCRGQTF